MAFSKFGELMEAWVESAPYLQAKALIETNSLILFFEKDKKLYGAPETSRVIFARMKNPDKDTPKGWLEEANFAAFDLKEAMRGKKIEVLISNKDLKSIKILSESDAVKRLGKGTGEVPDLDDDEDNPTAPDAEPGMTKLGEK
jgi:hypothetical protein